MGPSKQRKSRIEETVPRTPELSILSPEFLEETGIPYQNLINLYLRECAHAGKKPALSWAS